MRSLARQPRRGGTADARGATGDERDATRQLLLGRGQRELVQLERPVLDVEGLPRRERHVAAERGGRAQDRDRVVVDVVHDPRGAAVLAAGEEAEPLHHDHARERIGQGGPAGVVGLEVRGVVGDEALDRGGDAGPDRLRVRKILDGGEAREPLGEDGVVGGGRPDAAERVGLAGGGELQHAGRVVEEEHLAPALAHEPAQVRRDCQCNSPSDFSRQARHRHPAEAGPPLGAMGDRLLRAADQLDGGEIRLLHGRAPADGPVLLEQDGARLGMRGEDLCDFPRDEKAGAPVRQRDDLVAVDVAKHVAAPVVVGERDRRVGVGVDNRLRRQEAVEQRLDRGPRARRLL
jgi:hypothetical protein